MFEDHCRRLARGKEMAWKARTPLIQDVSCDDDYWNADHDGGPPMSYERSSR